MTTKPTRPVASRDSGALVGGVGVAPHVQPQLFSTPQTSHTSDDYWTPRWLFDALGLTFDLDVACPQGGAPWVPAKHYYTQADDGLASPWFGLVWMNPPYSNSTPWVKKWLHHANGIALLPDVNRKWNYEIFNNADAVMALPANMTFDVPDDRRGDIRYSVKMYGMGPKAVRALKQSKLGRVR